MTSRIDPTRLESLRALARRALDAPDGGALDVLAFELTLLGYDGAPLDATDAVAVKHDRTMTRLDGLRTLRLSLRKHAGKCAREAIERGAVAVFERADGLESFGWRQSTPTVVETSDQPGVMIAHKTSPFLDGEEHWRRPDDAARAGVWEDVRELLAPIPDAVLEAAYGDCAHITVHRDGRVTTEHWWPDDSW